MKSNRLCVLPTKARRINRSSSLSVPTLFAVQNVGMFALHPVWLFTCLFVCMNVCENVFLFIANCSNATGHNECNFFLLHFPTQPVPPSCPPWEFYFLSSKGNPSFLRKKGIFQFIKHETRRQRLAGAGFGARELEGNDFFCNLVYRWMELSLVSCRSKKFFFEKQQKNNNKH